MGIAGAKGSSGPSCLLRPLSSPGDSAVTPGDLPGALGPWLGRQLRKRELERQKAQALQLSWKPRQPLLETPEKLDATPQTLQAEPECPEEAKGPERVSGPHAGAWGP